MVCVYVSQDAANLVALANGGPADKRSLQKLSLRHCNRLSDACAALVLEVLMTAAREKKASSICGPNGRYNSGTLALALDLRDTRATPGPASARIEAQSGGLLKISGTGAEH